MVKSASSGAPGQDKAAGKNPVKKGEWWKQGAMAKKMADAGRAARLAKAKDAHGLHDKQALPKSVQKASPDELKESMHWLKAFYVWMTKGTSSKSAPSYVSVLRGLLRSHGLALESMASPEYMAFVKGSQENCRANGIFSASVRQLGMWVKERGSVVGPWEEKASVSDKLFDYRHSGGARCPAPLPEPEKPAGAAMRSLFSIPAAQSSSDTPMKDGKPAEEAEETPDKVAAPKRGRKKKAVSTAEKVEGEDGAAPVKKPRAKGKSKARAAAARADDGEAKPQKPDAQNGLSNETAEKSPAAKGRRPTPKKQASEGKPAEQAPKEEVPKQKRATPRKQPPSGEVASPEAAATAAALDTKKSAVDKKELGRQQQLADLMKTARGHIQKRDFARAEQVAKVLTSFCDKEGMPRPETLRDATAKKEDAAAEALEGADEAPKGDELEVARDVCRRCFQLRRPKEADEEDDGDVVPAPKKAERVGRKKAAEAAAEADAEDDAAEEDGSAAVTSAAKFAKIPEADGEDYLRLHEVAAAFCAHLTQKRKDEKSAEESKTAFLELFQLDDKGFDAMAGSDYVALVSAEDKRHGEVAKDFAAFWKAQKGKPLPSAPPRLPTSEERNLAVESGVPPSWRVQVFHRMKRDDLVVLTAPDGSHEYTTKAGLRAMADTDETFASEKQRAETELRESIEQKAQKQAASAASLARRRQFIEERLHFRKQGAHERELARKRFDEIFGRICAGGDEEGVALHGSLPTDCLGSYVRLAEPFEGRPAFERLNLLDGRRAFLFHCKGRWLVAAALDAEAQPFAYVEDGAQAPHEIDRDGAPWMVPADELDGRDFEEVQGAPVWCLHLPGQELLRRAFKMLLNKGEQQVDELEDLEGKAQRLAWESYDDVPDATPEERASYPAILKKFHEEGYPYLTGVRKLMARYLKSPAAMATKEFHQLVRNDPMNAVCNGFDSSAVLYFIMFWGKWSTMAFEPLPKKTDKEIELMETKEQKAYLRDMARYDVEGRDAYEIKEQGSVLQDLQIDMPLTRLIADVTVRWKQDLSEFLSPEGFLQDDADASGLRAAKCGADLLPDPTLEEWSSWSGVLKAFDTWSLGSRGASATRGKHTEFVQRLVHLHGKAPAVVAMQRYATVVLHEFGKDSPCTAAVAAFAEFWEERAGTKMPDPTKGLLFGAKLPPRLRVQPLERVAATILVRRRLGLPATWDLDLEPFRAVEPADEGGRVFDSEAALADELQKQLEARQNEQRRKNAVALEWNLPPRFEVEFEEDGTPYVMSPEGDIRYDSPEAVPRPAWMFQDRAPRSVVSRAPAASSAAARMEKEMVAAAMRFDFDEVRRLMSSKERMLAQSTPKKGKAAAGSAPTAAAIAAEGPSTPAAGEKTKSSGGSDGEDVPMTDAAGAAAANDGPAGKTEADAKTTPSKGRVVCEARCRAGRMPIVKKVDQAEGAATKKYTKNVGLKQLQEQQIQTGELMLKAHCWRLVGIRNPADGGIIPVDRCSEVDPTKVTCVVAQIAEDINKAEQERLRKQWGIDESWQVMIRTRLTGNQVTVVNPEGRHFFKRTQLDASKRKDSMKRRQIQEAASHQELVSLLQGASANGVFEIVEAKAEDLNGVYRQRADLLPEVRYTKCCKALSGTGCAVEVHREGSYWRFVSEGGGVLATVNGGSMPFGSPILAGDGSDGAALPCVVRALEPGQVVKVVLERSSLSVAKKSSRLGLASEGKSEASKGSGTTRALQREAFEQRLRDLGARRQDAPRTLGAMSRHMLKKLLTARPDLGASIHRFFRGAPGGVRLGTLCSGTDSPGIAIKHLTAALAETISGADSKDFGFEHVFSCEFDEAKQGFLLGNFDMQHLFSDCTQMGRQRAWDVKSGDVRQVPGGMDFLVAGFSCKDLSFMNSYRKTLEEMGQSGRTLRGCFDYVERYRPRVVLLENVFAIDRADQHGLKQVNIVMEGLRLRGYASGYTLMNSCDYYLPQIRHRIWMWGFRMDKELDPSESPEDVRERSFQKGLELNPQVQELLKLLEEPSALHFDDLLLPEDDSRISEDKRHYHAKARRRQERKLNNGGEDVGRAASAKLTWQQKYTMHRMKLDYAQERPYTSERGATWKGMLNDRTLELLDLKCLDVLNEQGMDPREVPMLWDLLQSVERVPGSRVRRDRQNYATCVLPPSLLWHTVRHRYILGQEKLALQGIFEEDLKDLSSFPQALLGDLAGNAFTSSVCLACMLVATAVADEATKPSTGISPSRMLPAPQDAEMEDEAAEPSHEAEGSTKRRRKQ